MVCALESIVKGLEGKETCRDEITESPVMKTHIQRLIEVECVLENYRLKMHLEELLKII